MDNTLPRSKRPFRTFLLFLYVFSTVIYLYLILDGWSYYTTPMLQRPHHEAYRIFKPGGIRGHGYGIIGSAMMLVMLLYSARKRIRKFPRLGSISKWLDMHIYFGIFGPLLVILHSTLKIHGLVAVSFYSMIAVALSGILGRYLYLQIPRNIHGHELSLKEISETRRRLTDDLVSNFGLDEEMIRQLKLVTVSKKPARKNALLFLIGLLVDDFQTRVSLRKFKREYVARQNLPLAQLKRMLSLTREKAMLERRVLILHRVQQLFHYWHVIHKPFAIIMILIMFVHVIVAVTFGYTWVF
ncbi:MAG: hypothetical protein GXO75_04305 [Calditrichaeota bacterium]|nr:hypothetical protein [Calditrichota bacterium]